MARVQYGAIVTEIKGSIAGQVFQAGNNSKVLRNKGYRKGTSSAARQAAVLNMTSQTMRWRSLTQEQRDAWNGATSSWAFTDKFGNSYFGSGYQMFTAYNTGLLSIGESVVTVPDNPQDVEPVTELGVQYSVGSNGTVNWEPTTLTDQVIQFFASAPVSAGRNTNNIGYKYLGLMNSNTSDEFDLSSAYQPVYGVPPVGSMIVVKCLVRNTLFPRVFQTTIISTVVVS